MHEFGAGTHVGNLRDNNEDSYVCDSDKELWIVADGMGGLGFGEVASAITTYTVATHIKSGHGVNQAIELAHARIKEYAEAEALGTNMGTTIVLLLSQGSLYNVFWVGDSRAYLFDNGAISQLTVDHSLVQSLIDTGEITQEEAESDPRKNAVTRALGVQELETVRADSISDKWQPGQKVLLCSDGLTDCVSTEVIAEVLGEEGPSDQEKVDELIAKALANGGKDNITVIVVSASRLARKADSDTHVPTDITDSTHVPGSHDTTQNKEQAKPAQPADHTTPPAPAVTAITDTIDRSPGESRSNGWFDWQQWLIGATMLVCAVLFGQLATEDDPGSSFSTAELLPMEDSAGENMTRHELPDIAPPEPGTMLQLGVFSNLPGAEKQQTAMAKLGLVPIIEKRFDHNGTLYAVLLGPYSNPNMIADATRVLETNDLPWLEKTETGFTP